jgi:hypothetical protein
VSKPEKNDRVINAYLSAGFLKSSDKKLYVMSLFKVLVKGNVDNMCRPASGKGFEEKNNF